MAHPRAQAARGALSLPQIIRWKHEIAVATPPPVRPVPIAP
jgi:hypothetical protein